MEVWSSIPSERKGLIKLRQKAIRNKSWFRVLSLPQRRLIDAVIMTVDKIRSRILLEVLRPILETLLEAIGGIQALIGKVAYRMMTVGRVLAEKISKVAYAWGIENAKKWAEDEHFIKYLTIVDINNIPMFQVGDML